MGDDQATTPLQASHAAWLALSHAADNLHAFRTLVVQGEYPEFRVETRPYGLYPVLRAAFENACVAVWLMSPSRRDVRVERRLRWALMDASNQDRLLKCLGNPLPPKTPRRMTMVEDIARKRGLDINWSKDEPTITSIVRAAGDASPQGGVSAETMWRVMSGMTHGDFSALLNMGDRQELPPLETDTVHFSVTASVSRIHMVSEIVYDMTDRAFDLYDTGAAPLRPS